MTIQDVQEVYKLETLIFNDAWQIEYFESEVTNAKISYPCVLEKDSIILGYAVSWSYSGEVHIGNIAIHPEHRGEGFAKMLMDHLMDRYKNAEIMYLEVRKSNQAAIGLYQSYGFEKIYIRQGYYSNGEDAIVMHKEMIKKR
jgi:ribosomal-protein-alanine N-acetyltransferase